MKQAVIAVVGVSGVGKTHALRKVAAVASFQHLSAGDLILSQAKIEAGANRERDDLRAARIGDNQRLLSSGFRRVSDPNARLVIVDGHTLIDTPNGLVQVGDAPFREMGIQQLVFLGDDPIEIVRRRTSDASRSRPSRDEDQIAAYQDAALSSAFNVARRLQIPLTVLVTSETGRLTELISALIATKE